MVYTVRGPVWNNLPQTPQAAEHVAAAAVSDLAYGPVLAHCDCMSVVRAANSPPAIQLNPHHRYAGVRRAALRARGHAHIQSFSHTPAHRTDEKIAELPPAERRIALGNKHVDTEAKTALHLHPQPSERMSSDLDAEMDRIRISARTIAATLRCFPKLQYARRLRLHERRHRRFQLAQWHDWRYHGGIWQCRACLLAHSGVEEDRPMTGCSGVPPMLRKIAKHAFFGHRLQVCRLSDRPLFFCVVCGAWALRRCIRLAAPCGGHPATGSAGATALKRIHSGRHPDTGERILSEFQRHDVLERATENVIDSRVVRWHQPSQGSRLEGVWQRVLARSQPRSDT